MCIVVVNKNFLMAYDVEYIFICYLSYVYILWWGSYAGTMPIFKVNVLSYNLRVLCVFWITTQWSDISLANIFSQCVACLLLTLSFAEQKVLILMKFSYINCFFFFHGLCLWCFPLLKIILVCLVVAIVYNLEIYQVTDFSPTNYID